MAMTPTYEITPGIGIGVFRLGDTLWHILELLRGQKTEYPKVEVSWDVECPQRSAVVVHLPHLTLYFPHSLHQRLTLLTFPNIPKSHLTLTYETQILSSSSHPLTRAKVGRTLGPTFASTGGNKLDFPGISFELSSSSSTGGSGREDQVKSLTVTPRPGQEEIYGQDPKLESCIIIPNRGVDLTFSDAEPIEIRLGETTAQDLLLDLGPPLRKFWKEDDRLERMWGGGGKQTSVGQCFWNYFQYGLDFLISSEDGGVVIKVLAHSNIPGTPLFQRYARCPWTLPTTSESLDLTSSSSSFRSHLSSSPTANISSGYADEALLAVPSPVGNGHAGGKKKKRTGSNSPVGGNSGTSSGHSSASGDPTDPDRASNKNAKISKGGDDSPDAMVLDRVVEGGLEGVINVGPSRLIGFEGLIIEEDQASRGICSVLVWREEDI